MPSLPRLTRVQADALGEKVVRHCVDTGVLPERAAEEAGTWEGFHRLRDHLQPRVRVPMTALTPLMARVLHACGAAVRPEGVAVLGSYAGNLMMWLTAAGFGPFRQYAGQLAVGVDVDEEAVLLARANFSMAGYQNMQFRTNDAFSTAGSLMVGAVDALLIDIDDPVERKGGYLSLLQTWLPYLSPGALVIAHDVVHPRFAESLKGYLDFVSGPPFVASTTLPVDECGVAVSALGTSA